MGHLLLHLVNFIIVGLNAGGSVQEYYYQVQDRPYSIKYSPGKLLCDQRDQRSDLSLQLLAVYDEVKEAILQLKL